jgi:RimJ/RimL family protein N-acetyltransferase
MTEPRSDDVSTIRAATGPPTIGRHQASADETILDLGDIVLRPWRESDVPALVVACQDPEIARWVSIPQPYGPADASAFVEEALAMWRDGSGAAFAIVDARSDALLGAVSRLGPEGHQATLGCWVAPEARGRGIGTRALRAVADWTLETTPVVRVDAYIMVGNTTSEQMTRRAGFQREGVLRAWDLLRGVPVDCVAYSRLRTDEADVRGRPGHVARRSAVPRKEKTPA